MGEQGVGGLVEQVHGGLVPCRDDQEKGVEQLLLGEPGAVFAALRYEVAGQVLVRGGSCDW
jgi:hypothetical protein